MAQVVTCAKSDIIARDENGSFVFTFSERSIILNEKIQKDTCALDKSQIMEYYLGEN